MRAISRQQFTGAVIITIVAGIIIVGTAITAGIATMDGIGTTIAITGVEMSPAPIWLLSNLSQGNGSNPADAAANAKSPQPPESATAASLK